MKKIIFILALMMSTQMSFAQYNVDQLFTEFSKHKNVTRVKLGNLVLGFASLFTETMGVNSVEVLAFEECGQDVKDKLDKAMKELKDPSFETMVSTNGDNERTRVMVKMKDDTIKELIVLTSGNEHALVRIKGNIKPSDIEKVVKEHGHG